MSWNSVLANRLLFVLGKCKRARELMFDKHLLFTNVGISFSLSGMGDVLQQHYSIIKGEKKCWDRTRTRHMSLSGVTVGILCHNWYNFLDRRLPGRSIRTVLKKVLVDQLVFSPVYITVFFLTVGLLEKASLKSIAEEVIEKGKHLYKAEWIVWPPAQIINFYFLPTRYRVLYDNSISLGYDVYTSHVKHEINIDPERTSS